MQKKLTITVDEEVYEGLHKYPSEILVTIEGKEGKAMADPLATVSKARLSKRIGTLSPQDIRKVGNAIKIHLDLH